MNATMIATTMVTLVPPMVSLPGSRSTPKADDRAEGDQLAVGEVGQPVVPKIIDRPSAAIASSSENTRPPTAAGGLGELARPPPVASPIGKVTKMSESS